MMNPPQEEGENGFGIQGASHPTGFEMPSMLVASACTTGAERAGPTEGGTLVVLRGSDFRGGSVSRCKFGAGARRYGCSPDACEMGDATLVEATETATPATPSRSSTHSRNH
mgnify:CR=1 FL=1